MTIYLFQYNNYYNRQVKGNRRIEEYPQPVDSFYEFQFNPNDGINTTIILNTDVGADSDYCIVCNDDNSINSRWFVMEAKRTRNSQYQFSLYRDLVYDYKDEILSAPCFIEKATLDPTNPLIFNNENFSVNQIKTKEYLLKDSFALPWIIAYVKKDASGTINVTNPNLVANITVDNLEQYEFYSIRNSIKSNLRSQQFYFQFYETYVASDYTSESTFVCSWDENGEPKDPKFTDKDTDYGISLPFGSIKRQGSVTGNLDLGFKSTDDKSKVVAPEIIKSVQTQTLNINWDNYDAADYIFATDSSYVYDVDRIWEQDNQILFDTSTGQYYQIKVKNKGPDSKLVDVSYDSSLGFKLREIADHAPYLNSTNYKAPIGYVSAEYSLYEIILQPLTESALSLTISSARPHTNNAPYDILAIPVGSYEAYQFDGEGYVDKGQNTSSSTAFALAAALSSTFSSNLLDIQLLPYAPLDSRFVLSTKRVILEQSENEYYSLLRTSESTDIWATLFYIQEEDFTCKLLTDDPNPKYNDEGRLIELMEFAIPAGRTAEDVKVQNECKAYRIVSPNYASIFNINAAKNGGLKNLRADCTYKPFNPYIRIYPEFNLLYGSEFGDNRGMIISGDFSLPRTEKEWIEYQLQNKNYLNIFDRQIDNLEFNNRLNLREATISAGVGALGAGVQTGMVVGQVNPYAGIAAGVGAGLVSAGAGVYDIEILKQRQAETLDFTKDQFGYQLGNIKARPDSVAKISSFDINSKTWPFVEVYECTPEEEQAFRYKLKWNGMTVGVIGTIEAFLRSTETYIKGSLIRLSDLGIDYHMAVELASEINKGVFI